METRDSTRLWYFPFPVEATVQLFCVTENDRSTKTPQKIILG